MPPDLAGVIAAFRAWLHMPDPSPLLVVLATVAANRLEGDPVSTVLVGPPGGGKSEILQSVAGLDDVHPAATLTAAALLSGSPNRERAKDAKGGLLRSIGDFGILLCKDFGSVLNMHREARAEVLAGLREVYDGSWTRHVGTDGGKTLDWSGKVGLIAGCTPTIDRHHSVMGTMGERFVLFRLPEADGAAQARRALAHARRGAEMRSDLRAAVANLFARDLRISREPSPEENEYLIALTELVVRSRSAVERDSYSRDIELVPEAEAPTRLIVVLSQLLAGLDVIGAERSVAWDVVRKAALDSIPALRLAVVDFLSRHLEAATTEVAEAVAYPTSTSRRALEDLTAHGIVTRTSRGEGRAADTWALTSWAAERYAAACVPGTSEEGSLNYPDRTFDDISGTQLQRPAVNGASSADAVAPGPSETSGAVA